MRVRVVDDAGGVRGRLIAEVDLAIGAEPHAEERKVAEHPERGLVLRDAIERGAGRGAEACQQRTHADPRAIAPDPDQQHAREQRAAPRVADGAEEGQEHEQTGAQPEDAAAAQREDERQRHDDDGDHRQVATQQLLAHARGAQERAQADAPGVTGPRGQRNRTSVNALSATDAVAINAVSAPFSLGSSAATNSRRLRGESCCSQTRRSIGRSA